MEELGSNPRINKFYRGTGCKSCKGTGYKGRAAINELLIPDDTIRKLINERVSAVELKEAAEKNNMKSLRKDGIEKAVNGITTLEEVMRVTQEEI